MKRCPQCNRVETDEALKFCRVDGAPLVNEASGLAGEAGTARLGVGPDANEVHTSILPHRTDADMSRATGPTTALPLPTPAPTGSLAKPKSRKPIVIAIVVTAVLAAATAVGVISYRNRSSSAAIQSIAVMPFVNDSGNADLEYLSDGMTETLINSLSQLPNLRVKARSSVFRYKGKEIDPKKVATELSVQAVLTGRVVQRGDQITLNLELIDAQTENTLWGNRYERKSSELVALQSEIARDVSSKLKTKLSGADEQKVTKNYTANPEAYQLYLKGNFHASQYTKDGLAKGIEYYNRAIAIDPNYALAYNGLAYYYIVADEWYLSPNDSMPKAREAAQRALTIDETLGDAHTSLAVVLHWYDWDWAAAEKEYSRAIELNPNDARTRQYYSWYLLEIGRIEEGILEGKKARELDPLSAEVNTFLGLVLVYARRNDQAIEHLRKTLELDPNYWFAHSLLGRAYEQKGDINRAMTAYQRARQLEENIPELLALIGRAYALSGKKAEAQRVINELKTLSKRAYVPPYNFAIIYSGLENKDEAFAYLDRAHTERSFYLTWLKVDPQLDNLRSDVRFKEMLKRVNLPE